MPGGRIVRPDVRDNTHRGVSLFPMPTVNISELNHVHDPALWKPMPSKYERDDKSCPWRGNPPSLHDYKPVNKPTGADLHAQAKEAAAF